MTGRPLTGVAATANGIHTTGRGPGVVSKEGRSLAYTLLDAPPLIRRQVIASLPERDLQTVLLEGKREMGTLYSYWHDTPSGFIEDVIGETVWGKQRETIDALVHHKRVIVPAGFGVGKTFSAGRVVAWAGAVNPAGSMVIVTTATRERQVKRQMWPHIRTAVTKGGLPGACDTMQWKAPNLAGDDVVIAYGFSAPDNDEAAMQGIHGTPKLLLVVDEAGGIAELIGKGTNNLLTGDAKMLAIGNPPMDAPGSWFERMSTEGEDPAEPTTTTVRIAAVDSPAITGEPTPVCRACVPNIDGHTIAGGNPSHLPDQDWLERTLREYGDPEHPYIVAKVYARFPKDGGNKLIPASWIEAGTRHEDPEDLQGWSRLCDLDLPTETTNAPVQRGAWVRLGVDVASDGGDELVIARTVGSLGQIRHTSSGKTNADAVAVAGKILTEILAAEALARAIGSTAKNRLKIDVIGLGWGVYGLLRAWGKEGKHSTTIIPVNVAEAPGHDDESSSMRPHNKKAEMWLAGRQLLQPDPVTGAGRWRLDVDTKTQAQLGTPNLLYTSAGLVLVEKKADIKRRGGTSPDRAEALLMSVYEPDPLGGRRRTGLIQ